MVHKRQSPSRLLRKQASLPIRLLMVPKPLPWPSERLQYDNLLCASYAKHVFLLLNADRSSLARSLSGLRLQLAVIAVYVAKHMIHLHVTATLHLLGTPQATVACPDWTGTSSPQRWAIHIAPAAALAAFRLSLHTCTLPNRRSQRPIWRDAVTSSILKVEKLCRAVHGR